MIFPRVPCRIIADLNTFDDFGQKAFAAPVNARCSVVRLKTSSRKTSVRTDSSGSGGNADEIISASRLLFQPNTQIKMGDRVEIKGISLKVIDVQLRFEVFSENPDHLEVDLDIWA